MNFSHVEIKGFPGESAATKIVEAYGLGKCPKLVGQICDADLNVRVNALEAICDEFKNPYSIDGCVRAGVIGVLAEMISDPDYTTRVRASLALQLAAADSNGFAAILQHQSVVFPKLLDGVSDPSEIVRGNVYSCLLSTTRTDAGVAANVSFGLTNAFVNAIRSDIDELKPIALKAVYNIVSSEDGLLQALDADVVDALISLLDKNKLTQSEVSKDIVAETARTLGYMCYDGRGKKPALEKGAVERLVDILKVETLTTKLKVSLTLALMAITITNDGKIQVHEFEGLEAIMKLLYDENRVVVLNTLKIISNLAVYPKNREIFANDTSCGVKLRKLSKSEDPLIAKHASAALDSVNWSP